MINFQLNDPSLESQWRAIILFGRNSATYKFAFAKSLLELVNNETAIILQIFEDVFMIILMKYAVRWNKCNCPSSEENSVNIIPI